MVANWEPKSANLAQLAHDLCLDIGEYVVSSNPLLLALYYLRLTTYFIPGSFIFVDDSPLECAEVRAHC